MHSRTLGMIDATRILALSRARVKQLAAKGRIGQLVAGRYLFSQAELKAFSALNRPSGRPKPKRRKGLRIPNKKELQALAKSNRSAILSADADE